MRARRVVGGSLLVALALPAAGCNDCGDYVYKGVRGEEWCGTVYGTRGTLTDEDGDADGGGVVELTFGHMTPPGEFDFDHAGSATLWVLFDDLVAGEALGADRVLTRCSWTDRHDPRDERDDELRDEPAVEVTVTDHGGRLNLDYAGDSKVRRLSWSLVCGDGVFVLEGADNVQLDRLFGRHPLYDELAAGGGDTGDTGG